MEDCQEEKVTGHTCSASTRSFRALAAICLGGACLLVREYIITSLVILYIQLSSVTLLLYERIVSLVRGHGQQSKNVPP